MPAKLMQGRMRQPLIYIVHRRRRPYRAALSCRRAGLDLQLRGCTGMGEYWRACDCPAVFLSRPQIVHVQLTRQDHDELPRLIVAASLVLLISASVPELAMQQWNALSYRLMPTARRSDKP